MKKLLLSTTLVAAASLGLEGLAFGHGGQYRGPGDTVPPGGGGGGGGGAPGAPGPSGPSGPGPVGPVASGPGGPNAAPGAAAAQPVTGVAASGPDLTEWTFWWEFNKEPYLNLKDKIHTGSVTTGSDSFFLGQGEKGQGKDSLAPSVADIRQKVVPALLAALDKETNNDIVTGALIALAKIGDEKSESGESAFEKVIASRLSDSVQEIRETAAVSLGILANESSIDTLQDLLDDTERGRKLVNSNQVNYRTRSFAAYGLGLIGARSSRDEARQRIVRILVDAIQKDDTSSRDLRVACLVSLGLVPISNFEPATPPAEGESLAPDSSRRGQLEYLLSFLNDEQYNFLVRAHVPTTLVRILTVDTESEVYEIWKDKIAKALIELASKRSKAEREIQQSAVLALGLIGDSDKDGIDEEIRSVIGDVPKDIADQQARNFSMIAMGKIGGTAKGPDDADGLKAAARFLVGQLSDGKQTLQPWAGLGIGVLGNLLANDLRNDGNFLAMQKALRDTLRDEKNPNRLGSYAVATGIFNDVESKDILLDKLARVSDETARGYIAVALGLMNERTAIQPIKDIVKESKYRPELLKQAAIALGLLGDKDTVEDLIAMLSDAKGLATQAALSSALGFIGDARSIDPLVEMLKNQDLTDRARGFAAVALGIVADKEPLPWNSKIAVDLNYRASTTTLNDTEGTGILNIL